MEPRFVTQRIHAFLDYPVAATLLVAPFLLHLGESHPLAFWLSVGTGVAALILTLGTDHELGVFRVIPYKAHLAADFLVGVIFVTAPIAFGFAGWDAAYYWLNGGAVLTVVALHKQDAQKSPAMTIA